MSRFMRCLSALCVGAALLATACSQDQTTVTGTTQLRPGPAAHDVFPSTCTTSNLAACTGVVRPEALYPEELVVCKKYSDGTAAHPAVTIRFSVAIAATNLPGDPGEYDSPTSHDFVLQPNECRALWWTGGKGHDPDTVTVEELPVPGYNTTSQVSTGTGSMANPNSGPAISAVVNTGAVTSQTRVTGIVGSPALYAMTVVFTNAPVILGRTMGFWGNVNGIATIEGNGGYAANAVDIGRGALIDTKAEALKVVPSSLNACGKGTPTIFAGQTSTLDCSLATGVKIGSLNTLAGQTLAIGYNRLRISLYAGQTIAFLACDAYVTPDLTAPALVPGLAAASTMNDAFNAAVQLINGSAAAGTTTQSQIGAMNSLLGCLNRET